VFGKVLVFGPKGLFFDSAIIGPRMKETTFAEIEADVGNLLRFILTVAAEKQQITRFKITKVTG
jgi:hypothetical protein